MAWAAIAESDVIVHISGAELTALRAAALQAGQADPVAPSISQVTELVRGYVAACDENTLGDAGKIPTRLLSAACDLVVCEIISRVPGYDLDDERQEKKKAAIRLLEQVAACKFAIDDPDTGADPTGSIEVANVDDREATRSSLDGL